jgi:anthranilate/para-aminobenzoate synthase component I
MLDKSTGSKSTHFTLLTLDLYRNLPKCDPAPYSGYFHWNMDALEATTRPSSSSLTICFSSPEQFLSIKQQHDHHPEMPIILEAEAKPIKGTTQTGLRVSFLLWRLPKLFPALPGKWRRDGYV